MVERPRLLSNIIVHRTDAVDAHSHYHERLRAEIEYLFNRSHDPLRGLSVGKKHEDLAWF